MTSLLGQLVAQARGGEPAPAEVATASVRPRVLTGFERPEAVGASEPPAFTLDSGVTLGPPLVGTWHPPRRPEAPADGPDGLDQALADERPVVPSPASPVRPVGFAHEWLLPPPRPSAPHRERRPEPVVRRAEAVAVPEPPSPPSSPLDEDRSQPPTAPLEVEGPAAPPAAPARNAAARSTAGRA